MHATGYFLSGALVGGTAILILAAPRGVCTGRKCTTNKSTQTRACICKTTSQREVVDGKNSHEQSAADDAASKDKEIDQKQELSCKIDAAERYSLLEELHQMQELVVTLHSECREHKDKFERAKANHQTQVSSLQEKLELLKFENTMIIHQLQAQQSNGAVSKSLEVDEQNLKEKYTQHKEMCQLREQLLMQEVEIRSLKDSVSEYQMREVESFDDDNIKPNEQFEINAAEGLELSQSNATCKIIGKPKETEDGNELSRKPSGRAINISTDSEQHQALIQEQDREREKECELNRYKNQVETLSFQFESSQHRESEQRTELKELKKLLLKIKRSEVEVSNQYKQEKMLLEEKQKQFESLEVTMQITKSRLARYKHDLDQKTKESEKLKSTQEEMQNYLENLVAAVKEHNPKLLEEITL